MGARRLDSTFLLVRYPLCTIVTGAALRDSLLRQTESRRGPRDGQVVHSLGRAAGGPAGGPGRYQGAAARETAESWLRKRSDAYRRCLGRGHLQGHATGGLRKIYSSTSFVGGVAIKKNTR